MHAIGNVPDPQWLPTASMPFSPTRAKQGRRAGKTTPGVYDSIKHLEKYLAHCGLAKSLLSWSSYALLK
jgi:hypothetical protein